MTVKDLETLVIKVSVATEAMATGIRQLDETARTNTTSLATMQQAISGLKTTVEHLDRLVRTGNGHSMLTRLELLVDRHDGTAEALMSLAAKLDTIEERMQKIEQRGAVQDGGTAVAVYVAVGLSFFISSGIALFAALK